MRQNILMKQETRTNQNFSKMSKEINVDLQSLHNNFERKKKYIETTFNAQRMAKRLIHTAHRLGARTR